AQVELLTLQVVQFGRQFVVRLGLEVGNVRHGLTLQVRGVAEAGNDLGLDGQLHRGARECLCCERAGNTVQFEQDAAGLYARRPIFDRTLALALTDFGRLLRHGNVGKHADPQTALTADVAGDRAAGRFDLARGDPLRLQGLEAIGAEVQSRTALGIALDPALEGLAELHLLRLQHDAIPTLFLARRAHAGGLSLQHQPVGGHRIVAQDLTLEDPDLDAADAICGVGFGFGIIDVRAQRVQRNAAFAIPFDARDLRAAQTAAA